MPAAETEILPPKETPVITGRPPKPEGFWSLASSQEGLGGSPAGVKRIIEESNLPAHDKKSLLEKVDAELEGTEFNYIVIHAHQSRSDTPTKRDTHLQLQFTCSKKNL